MADMREILSLQRTAVLFQTHSWVPSLRINSLGHLGSCSIGSPTSELGAFALSTRYLANFLANWSLRTEALEVKKYGGVGGEGPFSFSHVRQAFPTGVGP